MYMDWNWYFSNMYSQNFWRLAIGLRGASVSRILHSFGLILS